MAPLPRDDNEGPGGIAGLPVAGGDVKLVHYADHQVSGIMGPAKPQGVTDKPHGFWVSDDTDKEHNWAAWCRCEGFRLECLTHVHEIVLKSTANLLILRHAGHLDDFHACYSRVPDWCRGLNYERRAIDWPAVAERWQGIVITPYIWSRRLNGPASNWYYGWDCASGVIWDPCAVQAIRLRAVHDLLEIRGDPFMPNYPPMLASGEYDWP